MYQTFFPIITAEAMALIPFPAALSPWSAQLATMKRLLLPLQPLSNYHAAVAVMKALLCLYGGQARHKTTQRFDIR